MRRALFILIAAGLVLACAAAPGHAARIGVASVVKNQVTGSIGGQTRSLNRGAGVFQNETVTTGPNGSAQLLFVDETTLTLSKGASLVLDRFVYDPGRGTGDIVLNVVKGAFRFATGSATPQSYKIKTPAVTLAVRGTVIEGYIDAAGNVFIVVVEGSVIATTGSESVTVNAGEFIVVTPAGDIIEGGDWTGPLLDLDAGVQFLIDNKGKLLDIGGDVLPRWNELNDALDSRDVDLNFPVTPETPAPPPPDDEMTYPETEETADPVIEQETPPPVTEQETLPPRVEEDIPPPVIETEPGGPALQQDIPPPVIEQDTPPPVIRDEVLPPKSLNMAPTPGTRGETAPALLQAAPRAK